MTNPLSVASRASGGTPGATRQRWVPPKAGKPFSQQKAFRAICIFVRSKSLAPHFAATWASPSPRRFWNGTLFTTSSTRLEKVCFRFARPSATCFTAGRS